MANPQTEINPLESARIKRGISVTLLADRAGVSTVTLQEHPEELTLSELSAVASELGEDAIELMRPILARAA